MDMWKNIKEEICRKAKQKLKSLANFNRKATLMNRNPMNGRLTISLPIWSPRRGAFFRRGTRPAGGLGTWAALGG